MHFFSFLFSGKFMQKNIKAKLSCHKVIKQSFMLFSHCSEIIGQENWSSSLDMAFITKEREQNSRFLCCHGQNRAIHWENCFCEIAWLWHFHWIRSGRRAFMACIYWVLNKHLIDWSVSWWKLYNDSPFKAHCHVIDLVIFIRQVVFPLTSRHELHLIFWNIKWTVFFSPWNILN